jgi:hypothetical protein
MICLVENAIKEGTRLKNAIFWDVTPCGSCESRRFGGTYRPNYEAEKNKRARNNVRLLGCGAVWLSQEPTFRILFTLMMDAIHPSETSVLTRATLRQIL